MFTATVAFECEILPFEVLPEREVKEADNDHMSKLDSGKIVLIEQQTSLFPAVVLFYETGVRMRK